MALLSSHFQAIASGSIVRIESPEVDKAYPVTYTRRMITQYGPTVQLTLRNDGDDNVKVYLPKRYAEVFTDTDIEDINNSVKNYRLVYRGKNGQAYILNMVLM